MQKEIKLNEPDKYNETQLLNNLTITVIEAQFVRWPIISDAGTDVCIFLFFWGVCIE